MSGRAWLIPTLLTLALALVWTALFAPLIHSSPERCRPGFVDLGPRCCAPGQILAGQQCALEPVSCPAPYAKDPAGCYLPAQRIQIAAGSVHLGPTDWDSAEMIQSTTVEVEAYEIDRSEVDYLRYSACLKDKICTKMAPEHAEPGAPVTHLDKVEAMAFCNYAGGRLPTSAEWIFAAAGEQGRRFPWGAHGLVCRRASYGLQSGPCSEGGTSPELAGMRPEGMTPLGILDLAGNVAEWTLDADGRTSVRGGSFRSKLASELKSWSAHSARSGDDVGFRCVYPPTTK